MPLRPTASTPPTVAPGHGGQGDALALLGQGGVELGHGRAGPHPHGHLGRLELDDPGRRLAPRGPRRRPARRRPTGCGRRRRPRARRRRPDVVGERDQRVSGGHRRHTQTPSGTLATAPAADRRTGCRRAAPWSGWPRRRGRTRRAAGPARRGRPGENSSGMKSRFSSPMPCSPDSTPPASSDARTISSPAACTRSMHPRLAGVEHEQRVEVAVAGVEHVQHARARGGRRSRTPARSTSTSRVRGTTVSCR